jgi:hypothetical protein
MSSSFHEIAWNGIRFLAPSNWEIGQIEARRLLLEDLNGPTMEIKWSPIKGKFSHDAHFKRLNAYQTKRLKRSLRKWSPPAEWQSVLTGFEASGFSWEGAAYSGRGLILFCPKCRTASLLQFYLREGQEGEFCAGPLLRSFRDHWGDQWINWSVFGLRVKLPKYFQLLRHRFDAGKFELKFTSRRHKLYLHRWAMASELLRGADLQDMARTMTSHITGSPQCIQLSGKEGLEWSRSPGSDLSRRLCLLRRKPAYVWVRIWQLKQIDRLLGIVVEGKRPIEDLVMDGISSSYDSL